MAKVSVVIPGGEGKSEHIRRCKGVEPNSVFFSYSDTKRCQKCVRRAPNDAPYSSSSALLFVSTGLMDTENLVSRDDPTCAVSILVSETPVSAHKAFDNSNPKRQY